MIFKSLHPAATAILDMLREDHRKVKDLFEEFEQAKDSPAKQRIAHTAITELEIHAALEEDIIYPALRSEIDDDDLINEAFEEHHVVHVLIGELNKMKATDERFEAKFAVLSENVKHHIKEEESELFPKAEECDLDWEKLEQQVLKRKEQLMSKSSSRPGTSARKGRAGAKKRRQEQHA